MRINLIGCNFGRLTVAAFAYSYNRRAYWNCICICGNRITTSAGALRAERTTSCGCSRSSMNGHLKTHGESHSRAYNTWYGMLDRCYKPKHKSYFRYGGRGITVCPAWHKFENFLADMGQPPPLHTLDRIDRNKGYEKTNCRWATYEEQAANRKPRSSRRGGDKLGSINSNLSTPNLKG